MRFLFHFYDLQQRAGIQRAICELSTALVQHGHAVRILSATPRKHVAYPLDPRVEIETADNPEPQVTGPRAWPLKALWALRQYRRLSRSVRSFQPSLVIDHGTGVGLLFPFQRISGAPFVLQRHFPASQFPRGRVLYRLLSLVAPRKTVVVLTDSIALEMRSLGFRNIAVISNPIPREALPAPFVADLPRRGLLLGRAGNPQKGFDLFLRALAVHPIPGWTFQIVGPGVDKDELLHTLVRDLHLEPFVELRPATSDPYAAIRACACLIMPSRYEGLPMVALEALSIGRPILAFSVDGLRELILPGVNGLLSPAGDVEALSASLRQITSDAQQLRHMAVQAPDSVSQFRSPAIVQQWCTLAERLR
jgi:amylovoran biosynthesis glycosyltransferase AmsD